MFRIAVCVSGGGSLLPPLVEAMKDGTLPARISPVIGDRPGIPGLEKAERLGLKTLCIDREQFRGGEKRRVRYEPFSDALFDALNSDETDRLDLVVLAGFLSILKGKILDKYARRIINIHPALLPRHGGKGMYGMRVHRSVLAEGDKVSGCTVHYVNGGIDGGPIILQHSVQVRQDDTAESLQRRVHAIEGPTLVEAMKRVLVEINTGEGGDR